MSDPITREYQLRLTEVAKWDETSKLCWQYDFYAIDESNLFGKYKSLGTHGFEDLTQTRHNIIQQFKTFIKWWRTNDI